MFLELGIFRVRFKRVRPSSEFADFILQRPDIELVVLIEVVNLESL